MNIFRTTTTTSGNIITIVYQYHTLNALYFIGQSGMYNMILVHGFPFVSEVFFFRESYE